MKNRRTLKIAGSVTLILAFALFNIGVPVSFYLCPMMNDNPAVCPMMDNEPATGLSIVNTNTDCCGKVVLADRNTTPFVKAHFPEQERVVGILATNVDFIQNTFISQPFVSSDTPQLNLPPVFLLNSSFLI
ncbi:MAG TPA: hypothetical protein VNL36_07590 [Bacteroidota bacterium]|nr:hypothetical protein [Bacteroidota bacterium]